MQLKRIGSAFDRIHRIEQNSNLEKIEQSSNSLQSQINNLVDGKFDEVALNTHIEEKLNDLETQYAPKLTEVSVQLADTVTLNNIVTKENIPQSNYIEFPSNIGLSGYGVTLRPGDSAVPLLRKLDPFLKPNTNYKLTFIAYGEGQRIRFRINPISPQAIQKEFILTSEPRVYTWEFSGTDLSQMNNAQVQVLAVNAVVNQVFITDIVLGEKKNVSLFTKSETENSRKVFELDSPFKPFVIENGQSNTSYNAFVGGVLFQGKEYYVARLGQNHLTPTDQNKWGKLALYERVDGTKTFKKTILQLESDYEYRDPNLSISKDGLKMMLSATGYKGSGNYITCYWVFEWNMVKGNRIIISKESDNLFGWGNMIETPSGHLLKCAYSIEATPKVYLLRSTNASISNPGDFVQSELFNVDGVGVNETTIGYWRGQLIALARCSSGFAMRYTSDVEGLANWSGILRNTSITLHAPCLQQYNKSNEDLIFSASRYISSTNRKPIIGYFPKPNKQRTSISVSTVKIYTIDDTVDTGGYTTLVPNAYGYGVMYYKDEQGYAGASLIFKDVPKDLKGLVETDRDHLHINNNLGVISKIPTDSIQIETVLFYVVGNGTAVAQSTYTYNEPSFNILGVYASAITLDSVVAGTKNEGKTSVDVWMRSIIGETLTNGGNYPVKLLIIKQVSQ